ncbi:MAG: hypothetical protein P8046_01905 [Anaerolineales bacterium]
MRKWIWIVLILALVGIAAAVAAVYYFFYWSPDCDSGYYPPEVQITTIPLADPLDRRSAEVSGMDWYDDYLIILPQYFNFAVGRVLYAIPKADLLAYLDDPNGEPLEAIHISVDDEELEDSLHAFEGYESIAFSGNQVFLTIETSAKRQMQGYLAVGELAPDMSKIVLDETHLQPIDLPLQLFNSSDEAMFIADDHLITLYEANGAEVNSDPIANVYDLNRNSIGTIPFPPIEYRVTDATRLDEDNNFWVTNQFSVGSLELRPEHDALADTYGVGCTHAHYLSVERLVEMHYDPQTGISLTDTPPIQIQLDGDLQFRNWEAIVRLDDKGFLIATDKYPGTVLAFIPYP